MPEGLAHEASSDESKDSAQETSSKVTFEALNLHPGAALQMQSLAGNVNHSVRFIGAIKGKSILATRPIVNGKGIAVPVGQVYIIRGFTGKHAFAFKAAAIMAREEPSPYIHFAYPPSVNLRAIRKSLRVKISLPAMVTPRIGDSSVPVTMVDLSTTGSMVNSLAPIGEIGEVVKLAFYVAFESIEAGLNVSAIIRSIQKPDTGEGLRTGLEFENVSHNDNLILRCFVHTVEAGAAQ